MSSGWFGTLYSGMLAISQGNTPDAWAAFGEAGTISIAIAIGVDVAIGLSMGRDGGVILRPFTPAREQGWGQYHGDNRRLAA